MRLREASRIPAAVVQSKRGMAANSSACWGSPACLGRHERLAQIPRDLVPYTTLAAGVAAPRLRKRAHTCGWQVHSWLATMTPWTSTRRPRPPRQQRQPRRPQPRRPPRRRHRCRGGASSRRGGSSTRAGSAGHPSHARRPVARRDLRAAVKATLDAPDAGEVSATPPGPRRG